MELVTASAQSVKFRDTLPRRLRTRRAQAQITVGYRQVFLDVGYRLHAGMKPRVNLLALGLLSPRDCSELGITAFLRVAVARQTSRWQDAQAFVALRFAFTLGGVDLYWISRYRSVSPSLSAIFARSRAGCVSLILNLHFYEPVFPYYRRQRQSVDPLPGRHSAGEGTH